MSPQYFSNDPNFPAKKLIGILFLGAFIGYLNETLLNVALTTLMNEFSITKTTVQWSTTGFMLVMGAFTPITASIIQWFSSRTIVLMTLTTFFTGSLICALAPTFEVLLIGRLIQAVSAAFNVPLLMNSILAIYPPEKRGRAMSLVVVIFTVAPAIGPTLSGIIVDHLGWRYLFILMMPFVALAMLLVFKLLNVNLTEITKPKIDALSALLSILGFGGLVYVSSAFSELPLHSVICIAILTVLIILFFIKRQFQLETPLLNLSVFKIAQFRYTMIILSITYFLFLGLELLLPIYTQQVLLFSKSIAGLILLPATIVEAISAPIFGFLLDKKGARIILIPGAVVGSIVFTLFYFYADINSMAIILALIFGLYGIGISSAMTGETAGLNALPQALNPHGTAIINTIVPIAGAVGAAFFVGVANFGEMLSTASSGPLAMLDGIKWVFASAGFISLISVFFALKIKGK